MIWSSFVLELYIRGGSVFIILFLIFQELLSFFRCEVHLSVLLKVIPKMRRFLIIGIWEFLRKSLWFSIKWLINAYTLAFFREEDETSFAWSILEYWELVVIFSMWYWYFFLCNIYISQYRQIVDVKWVQVFSWKCH